MAVPVMLPCILGIIGAMLFYMERDNATLKNLIAIPVSAWEIATAQFHRQECLNYADASYNRPVW